MAAHIHISPSVGANGSVSIPLFQAPFVDLPGTTTTGLLAGSALMPTAFVGPYLEVLPNYDNVPVSQVLSQYVQTGLAYAQVPPCSFTLSCACISKLESAAHCDVCAQIHTMQYPFGALKATFDNSTIISEVVPAIYGASLLDPYTGKLCQMMRLTMSALLSIVQQCRTSYWCYVVTVLCSAAKLAELAACVTLHTCLIALSC